MLFYKNHYIILFNRPQAGNPARQPLGELTGREPTRLESARRILPDSYRNGTIFRFDNHFRMTFPP